MNVQEINLNLIPKGVSPVVHVNQYDSGRTIGVTLYDGPDSYTLTGTESFVVCGTKANGKGFYYDDICTVTNNVIHFDTTELMTSYPGSTRCVLIVKDGSNVIGTLSFIMLVQKNGIQDNDVVEEENYSTISELIQAELANSNLSTEVIGIRTGYDGAVYSSAGEAVREQIAAAMESSGSSGSGLSDAAKQALLTCFDYVVWQNSSDPSGTQLISALEQALYSAVYSVRNNLTDVTTSNNATTVGEGSSYAATLSADEGYITHIVVTMGGVDITSQVYTPIE